ncbi:MAG TPA: nitroreductase family protein [Anaerolineaceae bacterium]
MFKELIAKSRSIRRFYQDVPIDHTVLRDLVECARLSPSGRNIQALKFILANQVETNARVFECLAWAGYLKDWPGPEEGERPSAYIVLLLDKAISQGAGVDHGIAAQSILLAAVEQGLGGCMVGSIKQEQLRQTLQIPDGLDVLLVLALGKPKEVVVVEPVGPDGDIRYYRDAQAVHHVPKRALNDLILPLGDVAEV